MKTVFAARATVALLAAASASVMAAVPPEVAPLCTSFSFSGVINGAFSSNDCYGSINVQGGNNDSLALVNEVIDLKGWGFDVTNAYKDNQPPGGMSDTFLIDTNASTRSVSFSQAITDPFALVLKLGNTWSVFRLAGGIGAGTLTYSLASGEYQGLGLSHATVYSASPIAAIPEPGTYALMLAGLGAVGFLAQRRRRTH